MNKTIITVLITIVLILGGVTTALWSKYTKLVQPREDRIVMLSRDLTSKMDLILAEENVYQEYFKTFKKGIAKAKVLCRWMTKFQYKINLQDPAFKIVSDGSTLRVTCPRIILNDPAIDIQTYKPGIVVDGSFWLNEQELIVSEMQTFKDKSLATGKQLIKNPQIVTMCTEKMSLKILEIAAGLNIQADNVVITFAE